MSRKKRPGTRGGRQGRLPTDLADAAEAALDDLLVRAPDAEDEELRTQTRATSSLEIADSDVEEEEVATVSRRDDSPGSGRTKMPLPAPPRTTSVHTLSAANATPAPAARTTPPSPPPSGRSTPTPPLVARHTVPSPASGTRQPVPSSRHTPTPPLARTSDAPPVHTPTPVLPRPHAAPPDLSEVLDSLRPATKGDGWTRGDETARVSTDLPIDLPIDLDDPVDDPVDDAIGDVLVDSVDSVVDALSDSVDADDLVPARSALAALQVAVYEDSSQLGSVQSAIGAAGHTVHVAGAGRAGLSRVLASVEDPEEEIDVVIAALPGGEPIVEAALAREPRPIVIASLGRSPVDAVNRAYAAGADLVTLRPHDVERLAPILFAAARLFVEKRVALAARGGGHAGVAAANLDGDALDELAGPEPRSLVALDVFHRVLELELGRAKRYDYALSVALFALEVAPAAPPPALRGILRARAGNALIHSVRDIDVATQLEHERFLVLLPYTDLKAAAVVARRVIAGVAAGDPVVSAGRSYSPRVVGAVAGAKLGQPVGFEQLMKHASRALEQARRDGAELAVQP